MVNSSKMELNHNNLNSEIVLARNLNLVNFIFLRIEKIELKNESYKLFFWEDALIAWKIRLSVTFA